MLRVNKIEKYEQHRFLNVTTHEESPVVDDDDEVEAKESCCRKADRGKLALRNLFIFFKKKIAFL